MRENRTYGSEGGEDLVLPDPYQYYLALWERLQPRMRVNNLVVTDPRVSPRPCMMPFTSAT